MVNIKLEVTQNVSLSELSAFYRKEKQGRIKERALILLHSKEDKTTREIARILKKSPTTVSLWIRRFNKEGFDGLRNKPKEGRPTKVVKDNFESIREDLAKSPEHFGYDQQFWSTKLLKTHIKEHYQTEYTYRHLIRLFHEFGYSLIKPRPNDYRKSPAKKQDFKESFKKRPYWIKQ
jgi:putative transposase